jgi:SpoIID/LytB domain protein
MLTTGGALCATPSETMRPSMTPHKRVALILGLAVVASIAALAPAAAQSQQTFTFRGRGWGHGAGMSQWGARGLAEKGKTASQILKHYYSSTEVEKKTLPSSIRVGLLQERAEIWIEGDGRFDLHDRTGARRASGAAGERWRVVPDGTTLEVFKPGSSNPVFTSGVPVTVKWEQHDTLLELPQTGYRYKHGRIDVDINASTGKTRAIGIMPFEKYLYGLGEMPSSWHSEALEAQAVAGRTYALEKILRLGQGRSVCNCAVYATTADQAYVGVQHEVPRWVAAVDKTAGLVATYKDKPIQAFYSSSTGGFTENNENVFGGTAIAYLRGKCDPGDYFNGDNPHNAWTVTMDGLEVAERLQDAGHNVGTVQDIDYLAPRGVSGRVIGVKDADSGGVRVEGTLGNARLSGSTFRSIMGLKSNLIFHHITGSIRKKYDAMSCKPKFPSGGDFTWKDLNGTKRGLAQNFAEGRIYAYSSGAGAFWTSKGITAHYDYRRTKGHDLGMPTGDTTAITGGKMSAYERGRIYWSSKTAAHEVHGAVLSKYLSTGGHKKWGFPTTDELPATGGRKAHFQKARIYFSKANGAHPVYGGILARYVDLGGSGSKLGFPKSDEYGITGGRQQDFAHGYIKWNAETGKTSYKVT